MPDLRTALTSALQQATKEWAADDTPHQKLSEKTMNTQQQQQQQQASANVSVTQATFDCIRDNPGFTRQEIVSTLARMGYKPSSTSSLIAQMTLLNMVKKEDRRLYAVTADHKGLTSKRVLLARKQKKSETRRKKVEIRRLTNEAKQLTLTTPNTTSTVRVFPPSSNDDLAAKSPQQILSQFNVVQARALYDELKRIFGG